MIQSIKFAQCVKMGVESILTQILGMQPCTISMGKYTQCIVYGLVYDNKKQSQVLAPMQWKQCVLHDANKA